MWWIFEHRIYYVSCQRLKYVQALKTPCQVLSFYTHSVFASSHCQALAQVLQISWEVSTANKMLHIIWKIIFLSILEQNSSDPHTQLLPQQISGICDKKSRFGITLSALPLAPSPALHLFYKILLDWNWFISPHFGDTIFTLLLSSPSSLSMTLGTKTTQTHSCLVPARKPSACQAPGKHRRNHKARGRFFSSTAKAKRAIW